MVLYLDNESVNDAKELDREQKLIIIGTLCRRVPEFSLNFNFF
jgi:hypothetical protein